jgi:hypothetical protein
MLNRVLLAPEAHPLGFAPRCFNSHNPFLLRINQLAASQVVTPSALLARLPMPESHSP